MLTNIYLISRIQLIMALIRRTTCAVIMLVLLVVASPFSVFGVPVCFSIFPLNTGHESCEATANCMWNCLMIAPINPISRQKSLPQSSASQPFPCPCRSASKTSTQETIPQSIIRINGRVSGIRRIYPKNVLNHPQRKEVYNLIVENPGIDLGRIGQALDLNRETLRYHIDLLMSSNKIVMMKVYGILRFYENHGRFCILERRVLAHLWNPTAEQILSIVKSNPEITQGDIATRLAMASPTVHWYMQRFATDGIVTAQRTGRLTHYSVTGEALQVLTNPDGIRQSIQPEAYAQ
jgi:Winged helix-turn-helix DNA-binding